MISRERALRLREAGLVWRHPQAGDAFSMLAEEFAGEAFTVSDMTVESHEFDTGTILGFNGTTEWALDSVAVEDTVWLPREEQLRGLLGGAFRSLTAGQDGLAVEIEFAGSTRRFVAGDAGDAYADALLALIAASA